MSAAARFVLEALFIVVVAIGVAVARAGSVATVLSMLGAWIVVALFERAARSRRSRVSD